MLTPGELGLPHGVVRDGVEDFLPGHAGGGSSVLDGFGGAAGLLQVLLGEVLELQISDW